MRRIALALTLLIGCGDTDTMPDAGPTDPDADTSRDPTALTDGSYDLEWTCLEGCIYNAPFRAGLDGLDVTGSTLSYTSSCCDVATERSYEAVLGDCVDAPGLFAGESQATEPYSFCPAIGGPVAMIEWTNFSGRQLRYQLRATPRP